MKMIQISPAAARVNAGLTQREVAKAMNVSQNTIINWEKHSSSPTINQARALAELYNIPSDAIKWA